MAALPERKVAIVRTLVETAPEKILLNLRQALEGTEDESSLGGVRKLVETEIADRALRNAVLEPVVSMFNAASREPRRLTFPPRALTLIWKALHEVEGPAIAAARTARDSQKPTHNLTSKYDTLVAVAANGLRGTGAPGFQTAADLCDQARPGGARLLVGCLDIVPVVRRCAERLPVWIAHPGGETAAAARLAYKDAVEVADDAGPRFFAMIAAQLAHPWMVLRVISAVMDRPTERYMADSELADFAEVVMDEIDDVLSIVDDLDLTGGAVAGTQAAVQAGLVVQKIHEIETAIDLQRENGWGRRVHQQRLSLASVVEGRLRDAEKAVTDALPMHTIKGGRVSRTLPQLTTMPVQADVQEARALLALCNELRSAANYGGFASVRAKVIESLTEYLGQYVEQVLELIRQNEVEDHTSAAAYLEITAEFSERVAGEKAGELVRRRAHAALNASAQIEAQG